MKQINRIITILLHSTQCFNYVCVDYIICSRLSHDPTTLDLAICTVGIYRVLLGMEIS